MSDAIMSAELRQRLERFVEAAIDLLDAIDAPAEDLEPEEDCCAAYDDWGGRPLRLGDALGDPQDVEDDEPAERNVEDEPEAIRTEGGQ